MKTTINYSKSVTPNFDAVNDILEYLGGRYAAIALEMGKVTDRDRFAFYCGLAGIEGFPVRAWYRHFHGGNSWPEPDTTDPTMPMGPEGNSRID